MREAWRLVEPIVLGRVAARAIAAALLALLLGAPVDAWPLVVVAALTAGATPLVERAAVLRDLEREGISFRAAREVTLVSGALGALASLQLLLFDPGSGVGPAAQAGALASALRAIETLGAEALVARVIGLSVVGVLVGGLSGGLALDRLASRRPDDGGPALWLSGVAASVGVFFAALFVIGRGPRELPNAVILIPVASLAAGVVLATAGLFVWFTDRIADALVRACGAPPSAVETPANSDASIPPGPPFA